MITLQGLKKRKKIKNAVIGAALHRSESTVSQILQGRHIHTVTIEDLRGLADALGVSLNEVINAMEQSYLVFCEQHRLQKPEDALLSHFKEER